MIRTKEISGTHLQGNLTIPYNDLVRVFGKPHNLGDNYKTDVQWGFIEETDEFDNVTFTIYNWKNGPAYLGEGKVEEITDWNVGGHNTKALAIVKSYLRHPFYRNYYG